MSNLLIKSGQTVVFAGDSITDCGRRGAERPYGNGYVRQTIDFITAKYPERQVNFISASAATMYWTCGTDGTMT